MRASCLIALLLLGACSSRAWYAGVQHGAEDACRRKPESEIQHCLDRLNKQDYDRYEKSRQP